MIFKNQQIPVSELPQVEDVIFQPLAPAALRVRYLGNAIFMAAFFFFSLTILPPVFSRWWWLWILLILILGSGLVIFFRWLIRKRFEIEGYALRQHDIIHKFGYLWRAQTTVPYSRVQHVEIAQGPIAKRFGLGAIRVFTAGGSSSDLNISGIELEEAHRIKSFIVGKAEMDESA